MDAPEGSFLDIVIKQHSTNKVEVGKASRIEMEQEKSQADLGKSRLMDRFLRLKYVLSFDTNSKGYTHKVRP